MNAVRVSIVLFLGAALRLLAAPVDEAVKLAEFIELAPLQQEVHASTIFQLQSGTFVAAWFAGAKEGAPDVTIRFSRRTAQGWEPSRSVAAYEGGGESQPAYNPVLYQDRNGRLVLFYSVGPAAGPWQQYYKTSVDEGLTWSAAVVLPSGLRGPDRNKILTLSSGRILMPSLSASRILHVESSDHDLANWTRHADIADPSGLQGIQATLVSRASGEILLLARTYARQIAQAVSSDNGVTWTPLTSTGISTANAALDAVRLSDGRMLLVYNKTPAPAPGSSDWGSRSTLMLAKSLDEGKTWIDVFALEDAPIPDGYSYPCIVQAADGAVHVTYTYARRRIKHVVLDAAKLVAQSPVLSETFAGVPIGEAPTTTNTAFTFIQPGVAPSAGTLTSSSNLLRGVTVVSSNTTTKAVGFGVAGGTLPSSRIYSLAFDIAGAAFTDGSVYITLGTGKAMTPTADVGSTAYRLYNNGAATEGYFIDDALFSLRLNNGAVRSVTTTSGGIAPSPATVALAGNTVHRFQIVANGTAQAVPVGKEIVEPGKMLLRITSGGATTTHSVAIANAKAADGFRFFSSGNSTTSGRVTVELGGLRAWEIATFGTGNEPVISRQPSSRHVPIGGTVQFAVQASSAAGALGYQWFRDGIALEGAMASTLTIGNVGSEHVGSYTVRVQNDEGSVVSRSADLIVSAAESSSVVFAENFSSVEQDVTVGSSTTNFNAVVSTSSAGGDVVGQRTAGQGAVRILSPQSATLVTGLTAFDKVAPSSVCSVSLELRSDDFSAGSLYLLGGSGSGMLNHGVLTSSEYSLSDVASSLLFGLCIKNGQLQSLLGDASPIAIEPLTTLSSGVTHRLHLVVNGSASSLTEGGVTLAPGRMAIYLNGQLLSANMPIMNAAEFTSLRVLAAGSASTRLQVDVADVTVWSGANMPATMTPRITTAPVAQQLVPGTSVTLSANVEGDGLIEYQWLKDGIAIGGANQSTLTIAAPTVDDTGVYAIVATNSFGSSSAVIALLTATAPTAPILTFAEDFSRLPDGIALTASNTAFDAVIASHLGGTLPVGAHGASGKVVLTSPNTGTGHLGVAAIELPSASVYTLSFEVMMENFGNGRLIVGLGSGTYMTSNYAFGGSVLTWANWASNLLCGLRTNTAGGLEITTASGSNVEIPGITLVAGQNYTLRLVANGGTESVLAGSQAVVPGRMALFIDDVLIAHDLPIADRQDADTLRLIVTGNSTGSLQSRATIDNVQAWIGATTASVGAPSVTGAPVSNLSVDGTSAVLSIRASGLDLSYQWYRNGVAVPRATGAELILDNTDLSSSGDYSVTVANQAGVVSSGVLQFTAGQTLPGTTKWNLVFSEDFAGVTSGEQVTKAQTALGYVQVNDMSLGGSCVGKAPSSWGSGVNSIVLQSPPTTTGQNAIGLAHALPASRTYMMSLDLRAEDFSTGNLYILMGSGLATTDVFSILGSVSYPFKTFDEDLLFCLRINAGRLATILTDPARPNITPDTTLLGSNNYNLRLVANGGDTQIDYLGNTVQPGCMALYLNGSLVSASVPITNAVAARGFRIFASGFSTASTSLSVELANLKIWTASPVVPDTSPRAALRTDSFFASHMVLPRERVVPVWGTANAGETVTVQFADQTISTTAAADGAWRVELVPMAASAIGRTLTVSGSQSAAPLVLDDILVGDVWFCSGQSNMEWQFHRGVNDAEAEIAAANYPGLRLFHVKKTFTAEPAASSTGAWAPCTPETIGIFSALAYFFGRELHATTGVPIGVVNASYGGTPIESWMSREALTSDPSFANISLNTAPAAYTQGTPTGLYNAMVHPLRHVPVRGFIWYQGEANTSRYEQYRKLFPTMINTWRGIFGVSDAPFYFVQLANYQVPNEPTGQLWAFMREAQMAALALPQTGMAVAIDNQTATDITNIHPANKQEIGRRLARHALAQHYQRAVEHSGPRYLRWSRSGGEFTVEFSHADGLRANDTTAAGFEVAGPDRVFVPVEARIEDTRVVVTLPAADFEVSELRYLWSNVPPAPLYNSADLPASPFRLVFSASEAIAPSILAAPVSLTAIAGQTVSFTVGVVGAEPLVYTWKRNGLVIEGISQPTLTWLAVSAAQAGTYTVEVMNAAGSAVTAPFTLVVRSGFLAFREAHFSIAELADAQISGSAADPDGDGLANLLEFALGLDPRLTDSDGALVAAMNGDRLTLTFVRRTDMPELRYDVQVSSNLSTWQSGSPYVEEVVTAAVEGGWELVTVRDSVSLTAGSPRFMRLLVQEVMP